MRNTWSLLAVAAVRMLVHLLTISHYGVHRDELATFDDAHYLAWGFVAYPPLTPFIARVAMALLGYSLPGVRSGTDRAAPGTGGHGFSPP